MEVISPETLLLVTYERLESRPFVGAFLALHASSRLSLPPLLLKLTVISTKIVKYTKDLRRRSGLGNQAARVGRSPNRKRGKEVERKENGRGTRIRDGRPPR